MWGGALGQFALGQEWDLTYAFTADGGSQSELLSMVRPDAASQIEWDVLETSSSTSAVHLESIAGLVVHDLAQTEFVNTRVVNLEAQFEDTLGVRTDLVVPLELVLTVTRNAIAQVEFVVSQAVDGRVQAELLLTQKFDAASQAEILASSVRSFVAPLEVLNLYLSNSDSLLEFISSNFSEDAAANLDVILGYDIDSGVAMESASNVVVFAADSVIQLEWESDLEQASGGSIFLLEFLANWLVNQNIQSEIILGIVADVVGVNENTITSKSDARNQVEFTELVREDSATNTESSSLFLTDDAVAHAEILLKNAIDIPTQIEILAGPGINSGVAVEAQATIANSEILQLESIVPLIGDSAFQMEDNSVLTNFSIEDVEFIKGVSVNTELPVEATLGIRLDRAEQAEFLLRNSIDAVPQVEWDILETSSSTSAVQLESIKGVTRDVDVPIESVLGVISDTTPNLEYWRAFQAFSAVVLEELGEFVYLSDAVAVLEIIAGSRKDTAAAIESLYTTRSDKSVTVEWLIPVFTPNAATQLEVLIAVRPSDMAAALEILASRAQRDSGVILELSTGVKAGSANLEIISGQSFSGLLSLEQLIGLVSELAIRDEILLDVNNDSLSEVEWESDVSGVETGSALQLEILGSVFISDSAVLLDFKSLHPSLFAYGLYRNRIVSEGISMSATNVLAPPIEPVDEIETVTFDFGFPLPAGISIVSAVVLATVYSGTDPSPSAILLGDPVVGSSLRTMKPNQGVYQDVGHTVDGVEYRLKCLATCSDGQVKVLTCILPSQASYQS